MNEQKMLSVEEQEIQWTNEQRTQHVKEQKIQYLKDNYRVFGLGSLIYGILYAILLYENPVAITFPIIIAITLAICVFVLKKFKVPVKKNGYFFMGVIQLLAIAVCLTENQSIIAYNKVAIFLLLFFFMMEQVYDTKGWQVGKNIGKLFMRIFNIFVYYGKPWTHLGAFYMGKEGQKNKNRKYVAIGIGIAIPLVLIICCLLASADKIFDSFFVRIFENLISVDTILIIFIAIMAYSIMYSFICSAMTTSEEVMDERKKLPTVIAITFTTIIVAIYIGFCVLQISYLFNGYSDGMTYSQFAREGFFELLFVSGINLVMVVICIEAFEKSKVLDIVLIVISACTYILIGSSAYRMILYVEAYELTFLRIFVLWFLVVLAIWMTGAIIYIKKRNWNYFKFSVCVIAMMYLIFVYANPDRIIIKYNIKHTEALTQEDIDYFCLELEPKVVLSELENIKEKLKDSEKEAIEAILLNYQENIVRKNEGLSIRETNFAKKQAHDMAKVKVGKVSQAEIYEEVSYEGLDGVELHHEGIIYEPFGVESGSIVRGVEIGISSGKSTIYGVKGQDPNEWIFSFRETFMGGDRGFIYKAFGVEIPEEMEMYQMYAVEVEEDASR